MESITITTKGGELRTEPAKRQDKGKPWDRPDERPWQYFAWHCTLHYLGRSLEVPDYKAGTAHCERKQFAHGPRGKEALEGWKRAPVEIAKVYGQRLSEHDLEHAYYKPTPPTAFDVLYCIVADANCYEQASDFEGFCGDLGYDSDSRTAEGIYKACGEVSKRLRSFLGMELFARVLAMDEDELKAWCEGPPLSPLTTPKAWLSEPTPAPGAHDSPLDMATGATGAPDAPQSDPVFIDYESHHFPDIMGTL